jgi:hypothetical protein
MPFAYSAGTKLKLVDALSRGMYVVSTPVALKGAANLPDTVRSAETGIEWKNAVNTLDLNAAAAIEASRSYARQFTWGSLIGSFLNKSLATSL